MSKFSNLDKLLFFILILININIIFAVDDKFTIISPNYFNEQNNIYDDIHYLKNEFLSLEFCTDINSKNLDLSLIYSDNLKDKLKLYIMKDKNIGSSICYYSNFDLNNSKEDNFKLELSYNNNNKLKKIQRSFKKQKQSLLINHVLNNNLGDLSPLDLSYFLIVNNDIESIHSKKSIDAYSLLKSQRDNQNKCWPAQSCDLNISTKILRNLKIAGYDSSSRLLEDGNTYINNNLISNKNSPLQFNISIEKYLNGSDTLNCNLLVDGTDSYYYQFNSSDNLTINNYASSIIKFSCDKSLDKYDFRLYNPSGSLRDSLIETNYNKTFLYNIKEFACLGSSNSCDFSTTVSGLYTYGSKLNQFNLLENYINAMIVNSNSEKYLNINNEYENTGRYLLYKPDQDLLNHLKFKQNNDGSWGTGSKYDRISQTSWAVLGIQKTNSNSEYVGDGKKWIYYNEPVSGWGSIEKNSLSYMAIKEQIKPYLKINSANTLVKTSQFNLFNPTIYKLKNIKLDFSNNINNFLSYTQDLGDLKGDKTINFSVNLKDNFYGSITGDLLITGVDGKNSKLNLIKMPITIIGKTPIKYLNQSYLISSDNPNINLEFAVDKNISTKCDMFDPINKKKLSINLSENNNKIIISNLKLEQGLFSTNLKCKFSENTFSIPIDFNVNISKPSFEFISNSLNISGPEDSSITLKSTYNNKQIISIQILGSIKDIIVPVEKDKIIASKDTRDIYFKVLNPTSLESLKGSFNNYILVSSDTGYSKKLPININLISVSTKGNSHWILYTILGIIIFIIIIFLIRRYRQLQEEGNSLNNIQHQDDEFYFDDF